MGMVTTHLPGSVSIKKKERKKKKSRSRKTKCLEKKLFNKYLLSTPQPCPVEQLHAYAWASSVQLNLMEICMHVCKLKLVCASRHRNHITSLKLTVYINLNKRLYNVCLILTQSHTHTHTHIRTQMAANPLPNLKCFPVDTAGRSMD